MRTYISRANDRRRAASPGIGDSIRRIELILLVLVSIMLFAAMKRLDGNRSNPPHEPNFAEIESLIDQRKLVAINEIERPDELIPALTSIEVAADRQFAAEIIFEFIRSRNREIGNIGVLNNGLRIPREKIEQLQDLRVFRKVLDIRIATEETIREQREKRISSSIWEIIKTGIETRDLGTPTDLAPFSGTGIISKIKPNLVVRRPAAFRSAFSLCFWAIISGLFLVHVIWTLAKFSGDQYLLPISGFLCGVGFLVIAGMRDPLRDSLSFKDYAVGILLGLTGMLVASLSDRLPLVKSLIVLLKSRPVVPLFLALGLSLILILFGSGPAGSDARVNLGPFQPVEIIRILVVFYLAAYFDRHWEFLRYLNQKRQGLFSILSKLKSPRLVFFLPVALAMGTVLLFFFLQKDLGPALILGLVFLSLYAVARKGYLLIVGGAGILLLGMMAAYHAGIPETVVKRIHIFLDVWNNGLRAGDHIAHSLWALSTGGLTGSGLGLGETSLIPAGHTDLIISSIGEEMGWVTVAMVIVLYAILTMRSIRAALYSANDYDLFLSLGLGLVTGWQIILITMGILGLFPLSGVVSPFLSWGKSSMIANFINLGLLLSISSRGTLQARTSQFDRPVKHLGWLMGSITVLVILRAGDVQILRTDDYVLRGVLVELGDGSYAYQYNQRLLNAARILKTGTILDRNGIPLATSDCTVLKLHKNELESLGVNTEKACQQSAPRLYPFGEKLFHLLGDLNTRQNWGASNTIYVEREQYSRLRGFNDQSERILVSIPTTTEMLRKDRRGKKEGSGPSDERVGDDISRDKNDEEDLRDAGFDSTSMEEDRRSRTVQGGKVTVVKHDYHEILPLLRHRNNPDHPAVQALLNRERNVRLSIDIRLHLRVAEILADRLRNAYVKRGAAVVIDPPTGDILAVASYPWPGQPFTPNLAQPGQPTPPHEEWVDRAFTALRPPGSTFKIVTAMAALNSIDNNLQNQKFECENQGNGRVGKLIPGFRRAVLDASGDSAHGDPDMESAIIHSCNAYFAQLGLKIGAARLLETANKLGIRIAVPRDGRSEVEVLNEGENLLQGAYGQGQVTATPFQMARVAATVANGGLMQQGRWIIDDSNQRVAGLQSIISPENSRFLIESMRGVVTSGTASNYKASIMAGKTGTAQVKTLIRLVSGEKLGFRDGRGNLKYFDWKRGAPLPEGMRPAFIEQKMTAHGWFIGLAPHDVNQKIAFSVLIENGGSGRGAAAPVADLIVKEALKLGLIH